MFSAQGAEDTDLCPPHGKANNLVSIDHIHCLEAQVDVDRRIVRATLNEKETGSNFDAQCRVISKRLKY